MADSTISTARSAMMTIWTISTRVTSIGRMRHWSAWQVCLATTEDGVVGLTSVFPRNQKERLVNTMVTAVNREWRGKGLATALKTAHALKLRDAGWRAIVTQNMEGNDHILAANKRLGFQPSRVMLDAIYDFPGRSV